MEVSVPYKDYKKALKTKSLYEYQRKIVQAERRRLRELFSRQETMSSSEFYKRITNENSYKISNLYKKIKDGKSTPEDEKDYRHEVLMRKHDRFNIIKSLKNEGLWHS